MAKRVDLRIGAEIFPRGDQMGRNTCGLQPCLNLGDLEAPYPGRDHNLEIVFRRLAPGKRREPGFLRLAADQTGQRAPLHVVTDRNRDPALVPFTGKHPVRCELRVAIAQGLGHATCRGIVGDLGRQKLQPRLGLSGVEIGPQPRPSAVIHSSQHQR